MEFPTSSQPTNSALQYASHPNSSPSSSPDSPWQAKLLRRLTSRGATKGRSNTSSRVDSGCSDSRIRRYSMGNASTLSAQSPKEGKGTKRARANTAVDRHAGASPQVSKNAGVTLDAQAKITDGASSFASSPSLKQPASGTSEHTLTVTNISNQARATSPAPIVCNYSNLDPDTIAGILSTSPPPRSHPTAARSSGFSQPSAIRHSEPHVTPNNSPSARGADMGVVERTRSSTVGNDSRPYTSVGRNGSLRARQGRAGSPLINSYTDDPSTRVPEALVSPMTPTFSNPFDGNSAPQGDQAQEQTRHLRGSATEKARSGDYSTVYGRKRGQGIGMPMSRSIEVDPIFMSSPREGREGKGSQLTPGSPPSSSHRSGSIACPAPARITSVKSSSNLGRGGKGLGIGCVRPVDGNTVSYHAPNAVQVDGSYKEETLAHSLSMSAATTESKHNDGPTLRPALPIQIKYVGEALGQSAVKTETLMMSAHMQELDNMKGKALEEEQSAHAAYENAYFDLLTAQAHLMEAQANLNIAKAKLETSSMIVDVCIDNAVSAVGAVGRWKSKIEASEKLRH